MTSFVPSPAEEAVVDATVRAVLGCVGGFGEDVLAAVSDALRAVVPFDRTVVFVEEDSGRSFRVLWRAHAPGATPSAEAPVGARIPASQMTESMGADATKAEPRIVADMTSRTTPLGLVGRRAGLKSYVRLPLVHLGIGYGWWLVGHDVLGAPSQHAIPLLQRLAEIIAPAVARARLASRYRLLCSLVEESPDGMLALDLGQRVSESNAAVERMLGRTREEVIGQTLPELLDAHAATVLTDAALSDVSGVISLELSPKAGATAAAGSVASCLPVDAVVVRVSGSEEALSQIHLRDARARRAAEDATTRRVEQLAFQRALGEVMASDLRADRSLARAVDLCFVRFELGALCALRRQPDGSLRLVASHGAGDVLKSMLSRASYADLERLVLGSSEDAGAAGLIEATNVHLPDDAAGTLPRWARLAPLTHARRKLGALLAVGHAGDLPNGSDREVWDSIASTISVALHAADDYEQVVALEASNRQLVDNLPVIVARFDPKSGATVFVNGALERVLGIRPQEAVGTPGVQGLLADPIESGASAGARGRAARGHDTMWQDRRYRHKDGRVLTMRERVYPVKDTDGVVRAVELIAYDVTREIESRKQLMQADRLASLGSLAAGIAHEINNPVAFIALASAQFGRLLDARTDPHAGTEPRMREIAEEIREAAGRIAEIVGELKLFTRMSDGASSIPIDVNRVLQTALTLTSSELRRRARLEVELAEVPLGPGVFASLGQAFVNLLINAAQAIDAKSAPSAEGPPSSSRPDRNLVRVTSGYDGRAIVVRVSDTGVGIEQPLLPRIFDPFFTTKASGQGAGLGLAIAYDLVHRVGGDIRVDSAPGKGTTFEVVLPVAPEVADAAEQPDRSRESRVASAPRGSAEAPVAGAPPGNAPAQKRVLIIDDEQALVRALARQLAEGYAVDTAETAGEALARLDAQEYDVVVCDLRMPDQSGPAIYGAVLARSPSQARRFIFTTGGNYGLADDELHQQAGATGRPVLEKPFDGASFEDVVSRVALGV